MDCGGSSCDACAFAPSELQAQARYVMAGQGDCSPVANRVWTTDKDDYEACRLSCANNELVNPCKGFDVGPGLGCNFYPGVITGLNEEREDFTCYKPGVGPREALRRNALRINCCGVC